jgi:hypothetical protein
MLTNAIFKALRIRCTDLTATNSLLFANLGAPHLLAQPRHRPQEVFLIVRAAIGTSQETTKNPAICLTDVRTELGMFEELG